MTESIWATPWTSGMVFDPKLVVHECAELSVGDPITAWLDARLFQAGVITDLMPTMGLLWIREHTLGERRLLDMSELAIARS